MADQSEPIGSYPRPYDAKADALRQAEAAHRAKHIDSAALETIRRALEPAHGVGPTLAEMEAK